METEDFLSDEFLKQFKTGQQLNDFLGQIQKRAIEKMLGGELDGTWAIISANRVRVAIVAMGMERRR